MTKMKRIHQIVCSGSLSLLLLAGGCQTNEESSAPDVAPGRIAVRPLAASGQTDVAPESFGLYVVQKEAAGAEALAGERLFSNVAFARSGDLYLSTPEITFPAGGGSRFDLYAYAPYRETALEAGSVELPLTLAADQRADADFADCDLLLGKVTDYEAVGGSVPMEFTHAMSRVNIALKAGYGYTADDLAAAQVTLQGIRTEGACSFETGSCTVSGAAVDVTPHGELTLQDGLLTGLSAIVIPQRIAAGTTFVSILAGDERFDYRPSSELDLQGGRRAVLTLTLSQSFEGVTVQTDVTVTDWVPGGDESLNGDEILPPSGTSVEDGDGNSYGILHIGRQYWMDANLRTTRYNDGTPIQQISDGTVWMASEEGACCAYGNDPANGERYGLLYNRAAVRTHKLCPEGWHVPTVEDWDALGAALGGTQNDFGSWLGVAPQLKALQGWPDGESATNETGFGGLPGGSLRADPNDPTVAKFYYAGTNGYWWSDSDFSAEMTYYYGLRTQGDALDQYVGDRHSGLSVRCVHDF